MEHKLITEISHDKSHGMLIIKQVPDEPGIIAKFLELLANKNYNVDIILQNISANRKKTDITLTLPSKELREAAKVIANSNLKHDDIISDSNIAKISIMGVGVLSYCDVAHIMYQTLEKQKIKILATTTSQVNISVIIDKKDASKAVKALKEAYVI